MFVIVVQFQDPETYLATRSTYGPFNSDADAVEYFNQLRLFEREDYQGYDILSMTPPVPAPCLEPDWLAEGDVDHDTEDRRAYYEELNDRPRPSEY